MKLKKKDRKTVLMVFRKIKTKCGDSDCENCLYNPDDGSMKLCDSPLVWNLEGIEDWLKKEEFDDFFGIYLAQNISGDWHGYEEKPIKQKSGNWGIRDFSAAEIGMDEYIIDLPDYNEYGKLYIPNVSENPTSSTVSEMENVVAISKKEITREDIAKIAQTSDSYIVVYYDSIAGIIELVSAYLSEGYVLCGNLVVDSNEFYQPMIKYKK